MNWRKVRHFGEYFVFRSLCCIAQMMSVRQFTRLAAMLAWGMVDVLPRRWTRFDIANQNLTTAFGERYTEQQREAIIRGMWTHLFRMVAEVMQLSRKLTLENCREVIVFRNRPRVLRALCSGRPVFVLGGHFGNWEVTMATFGFFGFPMGVVGRALDNPYLHEWFVRFRESTGHRQYLKKGGYEGMNELLEAGGSLGLLCDQDAGRRGVFVDFFGQPASCFKSIALMAIEHDAIIVMGYGIRLPDDHFSARWSRFEIGCEAVIDPRAIDAVNPIKEITRQYTAALERAIERAPEQYFWVHRRWKTPPRVKKVKPKPESVLPAA